DIDDCPRVQLNVSYGWLHVGAITTKYRDFLTDPDGGGPLQAGDENPADPVYQLSTGAVVDELYTTVDGSTLLGINGTQAQLNNTLKALKYKPPADYHYAGSGTLNLLKVDIASGDPSVSPITGNDIEIRVLDVNDWPTLDGPTAAVNADPEQELVLTNQYTVADEDNDEIIDGDQADPPEPEETYPDGDGDWMLLIGVLDCGAPTGNPADTGFHFKGGSFVADQADIEDLLKDVFDLSGQPEIEAFIDAVLLGLETIKPGITTIPLATNNPFTFTQAFAGIADIQEVQYALDEVTFRSDAEMDSCDLITVVSDLGNNGLPLQYIGERPTGVEIPIPGFDFNILTINVGELLEIDASFDPGSIFVHETETATARINIDPPTHPAFSLKVSALSGTAISGDDFASLTDLTVDVPEDAAYVEVSTNAYGDSNAEGSENFTFVITTPTDPPPGSFYRPFGYTVESARPVQNVVILDDDDAVNQVNIADASVVEGDGPGATNMEFTLSFTGGAYADGDESVDIVLTPGTATSPADFGAASPSTVTFAPGATTATVTVPIVGDLIPESDETFTVGLTGAQNVTIGDAQATGTIVDDDQPRIASVSDAMQNEGNGPGTTNMTFTISLDRPAKAGDSVTVGTSDGTAVAPGDYTTVTTTLVFAAGETSKTVDVPIVGDADIEPNETFILAITGTSSAEVQAGDGAGTGTIVNDDGVPAVSIGDVTMAEGHSGSTTMTFTLSLSAAALGGEMVTVATADNTATGGSDYVALVPTAVTFDEDDMTKIVSVTINGDTAVEPDETLFVNLSNPLGLTIADAQGIGTITNDDISVTIDPASTSVAEGGTANLTITIAPAVHDAFTIDVLTTNGTAVAPGDYTAVSITPQTVAANATTIPLAITTIDNAISDGTRSFTVNGSNPTPPSGFGVTFGPAATVLITDDEGPADNTPPSVTVVPAAGQESPTNDTTIHFTVTFSAATGLANVTLTNTAGREIALDYTPPH
ncbi:MAG TPA: Calx-beta domain-containing protein, partial [Ilumatobacteraceae bacterium]|nr:Calx-beta domain-containing protein [Ilumatobacteraceae bacterium]